MITDLYDTTLDTLLINHAPLSLSEKKCILREILSVLSYLQSHHLLHNDLKPGNILYRRGSVALCDWGSAAPEGHRGLLPTLGYRPPELLLWDRNGCTARWSGACDVWSWAVVATELVGGKYLWNSDSELLVTNSAVKLAGTDHLTVEIGGICVAGGTATKIRRVEFRGSSQVPRDSQHVRSGDGRAVPGISPISGDASSLLPAASRTTS